MINPFTPLSILASMVSLLLISQMGSLAAQPAKPVIPKSKPNLAVDLVRQSGNCPKQVKLWTSSRYYEGGGENTVIPDTQAIANPAKLIRSNPQLVEFQAALKPEYRSCVAQGTDQELPYSFRFSQGNLFFRIDLGAINKNPSTPAAITYKAILQSRPYVRWAIAD